MLFLTEIILGHKRYSKQCLASPRFSKRVDLYWQIFNKISFNQAVNTVATRNIP